MRYGWMILLTIGWFFYSCENSDFEIGQNLVESQSRTIIIDTCSVSLTTLLIDSLVTSAQNTLIIGSLQSENMGTFSSTGYLSFNLPGYIETRQNQNNPLIFDSLTFELKHGSYFMGDTLAPFTINIHQLTETMELTDGNLYNTSRFGYNTSALAGTRFYPFPNLKNEVSIRLPDELGMELLDKLSTSDDVMQSLEHFTEYFKGFAITADCPENQAFFGFPVNDTSAVINLHYHYIEEHKIEKTISINGYTSYVFNSIMFNREGSPLETLTNGYSGLSSNVSNNQSYVMGLTGLYTRIDIPYLQNLLQISDAGSVQSAELILYPVKGTYDHQSPLPDSLSLYIADYTNSTVDAITTSYGDALQSGNLVVDELFGVDTHYSFTITDFIRNEIRAIGMNKQKLILTLPDAYMKKTFRNVVLGDQNHPTQQVKLKITYNAYDKN